MSINYWLENFDNSEKLLFVLRDLGFATLEHLQAFTGNSRSEMLKEIKSYQHYYHQLVENGDLNQVIQLVNDQYYTLGTIGGKLVEGWSDSDYRKKEVPFEEISPFLAPKNKTSSFLKSNDVYLRLIQEGNINRDEIIWVGYHEVDLMMFSDLSDKLKVRYRDKVLFSIPDPTAAFVIKKQYGFWLDVDDEQMNKNQLFLKMQKYLAYYRITNDIKPLIWITNRTTTLRNLWSDAISNMLSFSEKEPIVKFLKPGQEINFITKWNVVNAVGGNKFKWQYIFEN
jgi:hypothetical protein